MLVYNDEMHDSHVNAGRQLKVSVLFSCWHWSNATWKWHSFLRRSKRQTTAKRKLTQIRHRQSAVTHLHSISLIRSSLLLVSRIWASFLISVLLAGFLGRRIQFFLVIMWPLSSSSALVRLRLATVSALVYCIHEILLIMSINKLRIQFCRSAFR